MGLTMGFCTELQAATLEKVGLYDSVRLFRKSIAELRYKNPGLQTPIPVKQAINLTPKSPTSITKSLSLELHGLKGGLP